MNNDEKNIQELRDKADSTTYTFRDLRQGGLYIDKTHFIYRLVDSIQRKHFFLSRPRRFGKSLLLSTLESLFNGEEELFRGLYIHDKWDWTQVYPVIHLSIAGVEGDTREVQRKKLLKEVKRHARYEHNIQLDEQEFPDDALKDLILELHKKTNEQVVVLIDEYDHPILSNINHPERAEESREELASFYQVVKQMDKYIRFIFITGVSKFPKVSVFSKLNNLKDISLVPEYSAICGYTQKELEHYFGVLLQQFDKDLFREKYNGYNWLGESVYNPVDAGLALSSSDPGDYWYETGTPTFLKKTLEHRLSKPAKINNLDIDYPPLSIFDLYSDSDAALLFQAGYLTISDPIEEIPDCYRLKFPNLETKHAYPYLFCRTPATYSEEVMQSNNHKESKT